MTFDEYAAQSLALLQDIRDAVRPPTRVGGDLPIRVVSVTTTVVELISVPVGDPPASFHVYNLDLSGAKTLWVGDGSVTASRGAFVRPGQVLPILVPPGQRVFGVSPSGTISTALVKTSTGRG